MLDSQLMERFVSGQDPAAFRDLVDRHGPAVLRVCRRLVHDPHEAEDAMQATFLILAQRAPSIRDPEQLDRWLTGVARRVAARTRRRALQRLERERRWAATHAEAIVGERVGEVELRRLVREELGRLPEADRRPLTLCYMDGLTHEEVASRIGCPVGTIKARLVRARRRLRDRLDRRGIALGLALLLLLLRRERAARAIEVAPAAAAPDAARPDRPNPGTAAPAWARSPRPGWLVAAFVAVLVVGGMGLGVAWVAARHEEARLASVRLLEVLGVNCRSGP